MKIKYLFIRIFGPRVFSTVKIWWAKGMGHGGVPKISNFISLAHQSFNTQSGYG